ncbi:MAG TPA: hypothetical protein VNM68_06150, partial [Candidatus Polarisedimenticolia bacterium]|nr:hypothetical protein [Candidatus Polarisedimenticolia bacterium]
RFPGEIGREHAAFEPGRRPHKAQKKTQEKGRFFRRPLLLEFDFSRGLGYGLVAQTPHFADGGRLDV